MGCSSFAEKLVGPSFSRRLGAWLRDARRALKLQALAVGELAASEGRVAPTWRASSPAKWTLLPIPLASFEQLAQGGHTRSAGDPALVALGILDRAATIIPLSVRPRLAVGADALLIALHGQGDPDPTQLSEWCAGLEVGLSADRRTRLAEVLWQAVEQAADPMELTDSEARLLYANRSWEQTFGYELDAVVGQTVGRLFRDPGAPLHNTAFYQFTLASLAEGRAWTGALACRTRDGGRVFCEPAVSPFAAAAQGFRGNLAVRRNLAHRVERDEALAVAHREFRTVLSAIPDGVAVLRDDKIYFANKAFLTMVRRSEESVIGRVYSEFVLAEDRAQFLDEYKRCVTRVRISPDGGASRFAEISTAGAVSFEGKPAMILLSRDVTDYHVTQARLARAEKLSALGSLAAGIAHEINNPLSYIALNLQYIHDTRILVGPHLHALREAISGAERIQKIALELRGYSGSDGPGPAEPVDVAQAATSAINIAQNEIRHRARLERHHEGNVHALAREGQLVQVLVNLLINAAQAIPEYDSTGHVIRVLSSALPGNRVEILIADTGVGIAPSALPHVFDPFSTAKRRGEGSGLGLAISKRIVEELSGQITIRSVLGEGTTVRIELPSAQLTSSAPPSTASDRGYLAPETARHAIRVLVVDDESAIAQGIAMLLPEFQITTAQQARVALALLEAGQDFDVILCDLMMPGMPGSELYRKACLRRPELEPRFAFMTGGAFADSAREFLEHNKRPLLMKPFAIASVRSLVERIANETVRMKCIQKGDGEGFQRHSGRR